jgi:hypothetical protein
MSMLKTLSLLFFNFSMVFLKDLLLEIFSSSYAPFLSVQSYLIYLQTISMQMIFNFSYHSLQLTLHTSSLLKSLLEQTISNVYNWMSSNFLSLNPSEFLIDGLPQKLSKLSNPMNNVTLSSDHSGPNLGVIFESNLTFYISAVSKSCFYYIHDLTHIRNAIPHTTACTIATSLIHSKLD